MNVWGDFRCFNIIFRGTVFKCHYLVNYLSWIVQNPENMALLI